MEIPWKTVEFPIHFSNFAILKSDNDMLTAERIKEYALLGEGYTIDFKIAVPAKVRDLTEEVCSFANASGGYILIGIDNEGQIVGADIDNSKKSAIQGSVGEISPALHCHLYSVEVDGKKIWVIDVPTGTNKPYSYGGCIYMREGANAQKLTNIDEIRELFQNTGKVYFDATPIPSVNLMGQLDKTTMDEFRTEARISDTVDNQQILDNLQCFDINGHPKQGAVLFFIEHPEEFFFHAVTRCVRYKGLDKTQIIDDKIFGGSLMNQYNNAILWLQSQLNVSYEITGTGPREEIWEIPLEVFKESIINSLSHRDYNERGAFTMIEMYKDRVEISNPGGLLPPVAANFGRKSLSRNPFIFSLFMRMHMVEHVGSGITRMINVMEKSNLPKPVFETEGFFTVTFFRKQEIKITEAQQKILEAFASNPNTQIEKLCQLTGKGKSFVYKNLKFLRDNGFLNKK